jgi:hypothetical protein
VYLHSTSIFSYFIFLPIGGATLDITFYNLAYSFLFNLPRISWMINHCSPYFKVAGLHDDILNLLQGLQNHHHFNNDNMFTQVVVDVA